MQLADHIFYDMIGDSEISLALLETAQQEEGIEPEALTMIQSLTIVGSKQDNVFAGMENFGLPNIRLQVTGGKILVVADAKELCSFFQTSSLLDARDRLQAMSAAAIPDAMSLPSLCCAFLRTGDILYLPMGSILVEKTLNDTSLALRCNVLVYTDDVARSFRFAMGQASCNTEDYT